jgi:hypothetical protein
MASIREAVAKQEEKLSVLLKEAEDSPIMKQLRAEKAAAILATRTEAAGKIEVLKKEQDEAIPRLRADRDAKEAKYKEAKAALETAGCEFSTVRVALSSENQFFDNAISQQETILFKSADPMIDEAITFFREKLDWLRDSSRISQNARGSESNIFTEKKMVKVESNLDAILSALRYCQEAVAELERMKLTPALDLQKIEGMKKGIPDIGIFTEYTGEKPVHRVNTVSQAHWSIGRLNEEFKKVMGR